MIISLPLFVETVDHRIYEMLGYDGAIFSSSEINSVKNFKKPFFLLKIGNTFPLSALQQGGWCPVNETETTNGRSRVYVKVEPFSTFTFARGLSYIASISLEINSQSRNVT